MTPTAETEVGNEAFVRCLCRAVGAGGHGGRGGPVPCPYYRAPSPAYAAPLFTWTGFYVGLNGGGAFGSSTWDTAGSITTSGGLVGGTVGYNYQINHFVVGAEADIDWAGISGTTTTAACPAGCKTSDSWLSTIRGRVGYAADRFLPYFTGGAALGNIDATTGPLTTSASNAGWTVGAGLEFAFTPSWSAKAEYLYVNLGKFNCGFNCGGLTDNVSFSANIVRGGINYRF
jgi:outer membrane immunogenic protein